MLAAVKGLFNPAGGLGYHLRARRHAARLWSPFRSSLRAWLEAWAPPERELILVGPSAGYTLPFEWLVRFDRLTILDPDPLACWLLRKRLRAQGWFAHAGRTERSIRWLADDLLVETPERLTHSLPANGAILYANVLGQIGHLLGAQQSRLGAVHRAVRESLLGRSWASYHDRVSGEASPLIADSGLHRSGRATDDEVQTWYEPRATPTVLFDHGTDGLFDPSLPHSYFTWQLQPGYFHLVEATRRLRP